MRVKPIDAAELRRRLVAAGLDADYWGIYDINEMERRGWTIDQMVRAALQHAGKVPTKATA